MSDTLNLLIIAVVTFLVTEGVKALAANLGKDLSGSASAITAAIVALVMVFAQPLIAQIPASAEPAVIAVANLLLVLLGAFGTQRTAVRFAGHFGALKK